MIVITKGLWEIIKAEAEEANQEPYALLASKVYGKPYEAITIAEGCQAKQLVKKLS